MNFSETRAMPLIRSLWPISMLAVFVPLSGCMMATGTKEFEQRIPLSPAAQTAPIMLKRLISKLDQGQGIGTLHTGLLCLPAGTLHWKRAGVLRVGDEELGDIFKREVTKAGYRLVENTSSLFEDPRESEADYLVGGIIKYLALNICYTVGGSFGESSIEVEWQILDTKARTVILTVTTGGTAKTTTGVSMGIQAYYDAFAWAVRNLLAEKHFVVLISPVGIKNP